MSEDFDQSHLGICGAQNRWRRGHSSGHPRNRKRERRR